MVYLPYIHKLALQPPILPIAILAQRSHQLKLSQVSQCPTTSEDFLPSDYVQFNQDIVDTELEMPCVGLVASASSRHHHSR